MGTEVLIMNYDMSEEDLKENATHFNMPTKRKTTNFVLPNQREEYDKFGIVCRAGRKPDSAGQSGLRTITTYPGRITHRVFHYGSQRQY